MQLIAIDGVSINVPPGTPAGTIVKMGGNRFTVANCPSGGALLPVCVSDVKMMPSSRAELWITYRNPDGTVATPPPGATARLKLEAFNTGPAGERWPELKLANVEFAQTSVARPALAVTGNANAALSPKGIFATPQRGAARAPAATACRALAQGHRRRIFFGLADFADPNSFGLGYEELDANGAVVPGTQVPVTQFDPSRTIVCLPLGPGGTPVHETWELVNLATEVHNFHIHQTKFRVLEAAQLAQAHPPDTAVIMEDNLPIAYGTANIAVVADDQYGYCSIEQWRTGQCTSPPALVDIPFSQLGEFVYHCHLLEHEDGGMMARIVVVTYESQLATAHDFDGDGKSDILWRHTGGAVVTWLMNGATILSAAGVASITNDWAVVGQRDFNGDGFADILWRSSNGGIALWLMNGTTITSAVGIGSMPSSWIIVSTSDFNGDGKGDILWRETTTGGVVLWLMDGATITSAIGVGALSPIDWTIVGTGDFNGDGHADILWRNSGGGVGRKSGGGVGLWLMNADGTIKSATALGSLPLTDWTIVGTGDFNRDGITDILWRHSAGGVVAWLMNNQGTVMSAVGVGSLLNDWTISQTGDFNGDGTSDILWRNSVGGVGVWLMNGGTVMSALGVGSLPTDWQIQSANAD
jgi:hypothetical protein